MHLVFLYKTARREVVIFHLTGLFAWFIIYIERVVQCRLSDVVKNKYSPLERPLIKGWLFKDSRVPIRIAKL